MANHSRYLGFSAGGLWGLSGLLWYNLYSASKKILNSPFCDEALEILRNHPGALNFLGEPIRPIDAIFDGYPTTMKVSVKGPKSKGVLIFTVGPDENQEMRLQTIHLQLGNFASKRLIIKDSSTENIKN